MKIHYATVEEFEGWDKAQEAAAKLITRLGSRNILEIGAGANPTLSVEFVQARQLQYTTNDIAEGELGKANKSYQRLCHDFSETDPPKALHGQFDLVFSRMVNEHVRSGERYYRNIGKVLQPGGTTFHWFSTLYALPFLANRLMPEFVSEAMLNLFSPRDRYQHDKFRAYYNWGRGPTSGMLTNFKRLGFEVIEYTGYFGFLAVFSGWVGMGC